MGQYQDAVDKYGSQRKAARAMGLPKSTFLDRLNAERGIVRQHRRSASRPSGEPTPINKDELLLRHDPAAKLHHAARQIKKGEFFMEVEFVRAAGLGASYRHIVEAPDFSKYRGMASGGAVYWSHPSSIQELKDDHVLR